MTRQEELRQKIEICEKCADIAAKAFDTLSLDGVDEDDADFSGIKAAYDKACVAVDSLGNACFFRARCLREGLK